MKYFYNWNVKPDLLAAFSSDNDMWSCLEDSQGGEDGEYCVGYQTQTVYNHGSKSPIIFYTSGILVVPDLISDDLDFLQDETQFSM